MASTEVYYVPSRSKHHQTYQIPLEDGTAKFCQCEAWLYQKKEKKERKEAKCWHMITAERQWIINHVDK